MNKDYVTIYDLAKELGMSPSTVSRALSNHPRISEKTKEKVFRIANKYNYRLNTLASNLRKGSGNNIGIIVPRINRTFFADAIHGIESVTSKNGYNILICQSYESHQKEVENVQTLIDSRVDGILMSISAETTRFSHIETLISSGIPLVLFDRVVNSIDTSKVSNDNYKGAFDTTNHLIKQGYKNIAYLSGPLNLNIYKERFEGYRQSLKDNNVGYHQEFFYPNAITKETGLKAGHNLLSLKHKPDAILAAGDYGALGALLALKEANIEVPWEMGVSGYANEPFTEIIEPSMTTSDQKSEEIGRNAAEILLEEINSEVQTVARHVSIKPELIVRNSTSRL